ncbi:MAG: hypothetical protein ACK55X_04245 [Synechococcaceae cyanobacterium]|jgi:hypothetical protein
MVVDPAGDSLVRLSEQLHALSRVAETITVRLLELEEKLLLQQERLQPLFEAAVAVDSDRSEQIDQRLDDTEQRLAQLEELLHSRSTLRPLTGLRRPGASRLDDFAAESRDQESCAGPIDPFPEEGEQPFMDERVA